MKFDLSFVQDKFPCSFVFALGDGQFNESLTLYFSIISNYDYQST